MSLLKEIKAPSAAPSDAAEVSEWEEETTYEILDFGADTIRFPLGRDVSYGLLGLANGDAPGYVQIDSAVYQATPVQNIGTDMIFKVNGVRTKSMKDVTIKEGSLDMSLVSCSTRKWLLDRVELMAKK